MRTYRLRNNWYWINVVELCREYRRYWPLGAAFAAGLVAARLSGGEG